MLMEEKLYDIDPRLQVSTSMEPLLRTFEKQFRFCAKYPKVHGEIFRPWIEENHPGGGLPHVDQASGSRQDLFVEGGGAVYWNHPYCI